MRLQEVYSICKNTYTQWQELSFEEKKTISNATYYNLKNVPEIQYILESLETIESLYNIIEKIRNYSIGFKQIKGEISLDQQGKNQLVKDYQLLKVKIKTILELFDSLNYNTEFDGFDVKLPSNISLSDLSKCTKDLNTIFSTCPLFANNEGTISFSAVDVGSVWLSFIVGGGAALSMLTMLAALIDKAIIIRSHYISTKEQEAKIKSLELENEILENAKNVNQQLTKGLIDKLSKELAEQNNINDLEDIERLKHSIQLLSDWMYKGLEMYASIHTSKETKAVYPPIDKQVLPEKIIELLTEKNDQTK